MRRTSSNPARPSLSRPAGARGSSDDAAIDALQREFGFAPPLASLRYWLLGAGDPSLPAQETLDGEQRLARIVQDGWTVDYQDYQRSGGQWLPQRITLRREAVRVRLLVQDWRLQ